MCINNVCFRNILYIFLEISQDKIIRLQTGLCTVHSPEYGRCRRNAIQNSLLQLVNRSMIPAAMFSAASAVPLLLDRFHLFQSESFGSRGIKLAG